MSGWECPTLVRYLHSGAAQQHTLPATHHQVPTRSTVYGIKPTLKVNSHNNNFNFQAECCCCCDAKVLILFIRANGAEIKLNLIHYLLLLLLL